jgi:predicted transcriptional regulator
MELVTHAGAPGQVAQVTLESTITVPREHAEWLLAALNKAGIEAWDTGQRVTTEDAIDALADLRVRVPPL